MHNLILSENKLKFSVHEHTKLNPSALKNSFNSYKNFIKNFYYATIWLEACSFLRHPVNSQPAPAQMQPRPTMCEVDEMWFF